MKLLLVEDELADAKFVKACLGRDKALTPEIVHAVCLSEALTHLEETDFDVVILDLHLPDASGEECVRKIKLTKPDVPIVVLSGEENEDYAIEILNQGVQDYLVKWHDDGKGILRSVRYGIERKRSELKLAHLAAFDSLTQIPNRNFFVDCLERAVSRAQRNGTMLALLFLDLDRFKGVNDTLGHHFGDKLLIAVSERISASVRDGDILARMGGDEFALLLEDRNGVAGAEATASKLIKVLADPYELEGRIVNITTSIGITVFPQDRGSPESLLKNADIAMYQAKSAGRNGFKFFTEKMQNRIVHQHRVAQEIRSGLENDEFFLAYQPQYRLSDNRLDGAEALIRWNHKNKLVMPDEFIGIAEESGQIIDVGYWVIEEAFRQSNAWCNTETAPPRIAINISPRQMHQPNFNRELQRLIAKYDVNPESIEIELTESCLIQDSNVVKDSLQMLKDFGFAIAIDDFGTGHSCLDYLRRFPIDILKIDRAFVKDIGVDDESTAICKAILSIADGLNKQTIGEGIENETQLEFLIQNGCQRGQGFMYSKAVVPSEFEALPVLEVSSGDRQYGARKKLG
ncbi:MAG: EAL domain-containing protein [Gammaproteobacteria bacterium]|nr:EAL domain-containing protein [Gammaproteobacteria bacterium]